MSLGQNVEYASVSTPGELHDAVSRGVSHIVVTAHLDLTATPLLLDSSSQEDFSLSVTQAPAGGYTRSIRGNCSTHARDVPPEPSLLSPRQCVITVRDGFLDVAVDAADVWLSDLYIRVASWDEAPRTVLRAGRGDLWMTHVSLVGQGEQCRGIEVHEKRRLFARECAIIGFRHTRDAAIQFRPSATATFVRTTFSDNTVYQPSNPDTPPPLHPAAVGPDGGLRAPPDTLPPAPGRRLAAAVADGAASVSYHACRFESSTARPAHSVAIDTSSCRVYSDSFAPRVYDVQLGAVVGPWELVEKAEAPIAAAPGSATEVFRSRGFPREGDLVFNRLVQNEVAASGLLMEEPVPIPAAIQYEVRRPLASSLAIAPAVSPGPSDESSWSPVKLALVCAVAGAILTLMLVIFGVLLRALLLQKRKRQTREVPKWPEDSQTGNAEPRCVASPPRPSLPADDSLVAVSLGTGTTAVKSAFSLSGRACAPQPPQSACSEEPHSGQPHSPGAYAPGPQGRLGACMDAAASPARGAPDSRRSSAAHDRGSSAGSPHRVSQPLPTLAVHHGHNPAYAAAPAPASAPAPAAAYNNRTMYVTAPKSLPPITAERARKPRSRRSARSVAAEEPPQTESRSLFEVYANLNRSVVFPSMSPATTERIAPPTQPRTAPPASQPEPSPRSDPAHNHACAVEPSPTDVSEMVRSHSGGKGRGAGVWGRVGSWGWRWARGTPPDSLASGADGMHAAHAQGPQGDAGAVPDGHAAWRGIPIWGGVHAGESSSRKNPDSMHGTPPRYAGWPDANAPRDTATLDPHSAPPTSQRLTTVTAEGDNGHSTTMLGGPGGPPPATPAAVPAAGVTSVPQNVLLYEGASVETGELPELPLKPPSKSSRAGGRSEERPSGALPPEAMTGALHDEWWGPSEIEARRMRLVEHLNHPLPKSLPAGLMSLVPAQEHRDGSQYTVVQFARRVHAGGEVAVKFFLEPEHFQAERRTQYIPELQAARLPLESVHGNEDGALTDARGAPLPPCIVLPRGVPLEEWMRRETPDILHAVAALAAITKRLQVLHEGGYAHRNIKPSNILWLPQSNSWALTDLRCAARIGEPAAAARDLRLAYAAPELAPRPGSGRRNGGARLQRVEAASDAWALGVIAVQLLTGSCPLDDSTASSRKELLAQLQGKAELPWEGWPREMRQKLGALRKPVLRLLQRDPEARLSMADLGNACLAVFDAST